MDEYPKSESFYVYYFDMIIKLTVNLRQDKCTYKFRPFNINKHIDTLQSKPIMTKIFSNPKSRRPWRKQGLPDGTKLPVNWLGLLGY